MNRFNTQNQLALLFVALALGISLFFKLSLIGIGAPYKMAGKTGTAQVFSLKANEKYNANQLAKELHDHAWFIGYAPAENPTIVVAIIVENGGHGGSAAAPIARQLFDMHLLGIMPTPAPTPVPEVGIDE